jgi:hypothetical protein
VSEKDIQQLLKLTYSETSVALIPNCLAVISFEADMLRVTHSRYLYSYEIKTSRSDFLRDSNKYHVRKLNKEYEFEHASDRVPNKFFYVTTKGIVTASDIPAWAGWIEIDENKSIQTQKNAPYLHKNKININDACKLMRAISYRVKGEG